MGRVWRRGSGRVLEGYLRGAIDVGDLTVQAGSGPAIRYGDGSGPAISIRLARGAALKIALNPELKLGECYMDAELAFEQGDMYDLLELVGRNPRFWDKPKTPVVRLQEAVRRRLSQLNGREAARLNFFYNY